MKKLVLFAFIFLAACSGQIPQVTVSPEATFTLPAATQTPEPTATPTSVYTPTPAKEIITNSSKVGFELGSQIVGQPEGVRGVMDIVPADRMSADKQAEFEIKTNPQTYGFLEGETQLAYMPTPDEEYQKFRIELQRTSNPADVIAVFGAKDFVWDFDKLLSQSGEPVAFGVAAEVLMNGRVPENPETVRSALLRLSYKYSEETNGKITGTYTFLFVSKDGKKAVPFNYIPTNDNSDEGNLYFKAKDDSLIVMFIKNFNETANFVIDF